MPGNVASSWSNPWKHRLTPSACWYSTKRARHAPTDEIHPVAELGQRITKREIVVVRAGHRSQRGRQRRPATGIPSRKLRRRSAPDVHEMANVAEKPSASDADAVRGRRLDVPMFGKSRKERRKIHS